MSEVVCLIPARLSDWNLESAKVYHLDRDSDHPSSTIKWLWSFPSASVSVPSGRFPLPSHFPLFSPLIPFELRSDTAVCHDDTISASCPPSLLLFFQLPLTPFVYLSVSFPLTPLWLENGCCSCKIFFPTLSLAFDFSSTLVWPIQPSRCDSWSPFLHLSSFILGQTVRLGCQCYFTSQGRFIVLESLCLRLSSWLLWKQECCFF